MRGIFNQFIYDVFSYLAPYYLLISFTILFISVILTVIIISMISSFNKNSNYYRKFIILIYFNYFSFIILVQYFILMFTIFCGVYFFTQKNFNYVLSSSYEYHSFFFFTFNELSYFFSLTMHLVLLVVSISFQTSYIEERVISSIFEDSDENFKNEEINKEKYMKIYPLAHYENRCFYESLFIIMVIVLQLILQVFFCTENIFVFFVSFESSVLPIFFIIGFFGKRSEKFKAINYLLYFTLLSATPFLIYAFYIFSKTGSVFFPEIKFFFNKNFFSSKEMIIGFICFFIPFGVKLAFFPFHSWLPEAHVEASTEGSMLLSGIMLKLGFFGIVKYCFGLFNSITLIVAPFFLIFAFIGAFSTSMSTYAQLDIKKIIAYSSVVHMNIAIFGYFSLSAIAIESVLFMNFSHAIVSVGLFYAIGVLQDKLKTRNLLEIAGLWTIMPKWSILFLILLLGNAGMPGTVGFIAEAGLIWGMLVHFPITAFLLIFPIGIISFRNFFLFTQICFGVPYSFTEETIINYDSNTSKKNKEINTSLYNKKNQTGFFTKSWDIMIPADGQVLIIMSICTIFFGIKPGFILNFLENSSIYVEICSNKNIPFYTSSYEKFLYLL